MAVERWCAVQHDQIRNTLLVDPDTEQGQEYLEGMEADGWLMLPEEEAKASYPYWTPPS